MGFQRSLIFLERYFLIFLHHNVNITVSIDDMSAVTTSLNPQNEKKYCTAMNNKRQKVIFRMYIYNMFSHDESIVANYLTIISFRHVTSKIVEKNFEFAYRKIIILYFVVCNCFIFIL